MSGLLGHPVPLRDADSRVSEPDPHFNLCLQSETRDLVDAGIEAVAAFVVGEVSVRSARGVWEAWLPMTGLAAAMHTCERLTKLSRQRREWIRMTLLARHRQIVFDRYLSPGTAPPDDDPES